MKIQIGKNYIVLQIRNNKLRFFYITYCNSFNMMKRYYNKILNAFLCYILTLKFIKLFLKFI